MAKVTAVSGRWIEVQTAGNLRADVATVKPGWAHAFLERGPWRGAFVPRRISTSYDVVLTVEQFYVPDGGDGDAGLWVLPMLRREATHDMPLSTPFH